MAAFYSSLRRALVTIRIPGMGTYFEHRCAISEHPPAMASDESPQLDRYRMSFATLLSTQR